MLNRHYFSLRSTLGPQPSSTPLIVLACFSLAMVAGLFVDLGA